MTATAPRGRHRRRGFNHLKTIRRTLQNLKGTSALANELIQNADDASNATHLTFRFTPDALEVIDDGGFDSCDELDEEVCEWERHRRKGRRLRCDFHAFQEIAGASKEDDPGLTGAFGVGFLSVYQVTDRPELFSHGEHWILDEAAPEAERIWCCPGDCGHDHRVDGTLFRLPWASRKTEMRTHLGADPVPADAQAIIYREFCAAAPRAMVFLHELATVTIERPGERPKVFSRTERDDRVLIEGPGIDESWLVLEDDFSDVAAEIREQHDLGEREATVRVAVLPTGRSRTGYLHATLPTQISTGLPVHIDASFFPRLDRKGILTEGFEGEWNEAAIQCAAELVAMNLEFLAQEMGHKRFWALVKSAHDMRGRNKRGAGDTLSVFWTEIRRELPAANVMWTAAGEWARVDDTVLPGRNQPPELLAVLEALGVHTVSEDLRRPVGDMGRAIPTAQLTLDLLVAALERVGVNGGPFQPGSLPAGLSRRGHRNALLRELATFPQAELDSLKDRLRALALWRTQHGAYASLASCYAADKDAIAIFGTSSGRPLIDENAQPTFALPLLALADRWTIDQAVNTLRASRLPQPQTDAQAIELLKWLDRHRPLNLVHRASLADVPLLPTGRGIASPNASVIPGGFADPLGITADINPKVASRFGDLLEALDVGHLGLTDYVVEFVPRALEAGLNNDQLLQLLDLLVDNARTLEADEDAADALCELAWVPCTDGTPRRPPETYFDLPIIREILGDSVPFVDRSVRPQGVRADFLHWLGTRREPAPEDLIEHIRAITGEPPTKRSLAEVLRALQYLDDTRADTGADGPFAELRELEWLPVAGLSRWAKPSELFFTKLRYLFETTGSFIALSAIEQEKLRSVLGADGLAVRQKPDIEQVTGHVRNLVARGSQITEAIWKFLDEAGPHAALTGLQNIRCWPTTSGDQVTADGLFREDHKLVPLRAALAGPVRRFDKLLDAVGVAVSPSAEDGIDVLLEIAADAAEEPIKRDLATIVRECWRLLGDEDVDLDRLSGHAVVLGGDGRLHESNRVLFNDNPAVATRFDDATQQRLITKGDTWRALDRAGVRALSSRLRSRLVDHGDPVADDHVARRIHERQPHLARIAEREGGSWQRVLEFARALEVETYDSVEVVYEIEGFGAPGTPSEVVAAHYITHETRLVVSLRSGRTEWREVARCLREPLLPDASSPAVLLMICDVLRAESAAEAHRRLDEVGYDRIDDDAFAEELARRASRAAAEPATADGSDDDESSDEEVPDDEFEPAEPGDDDATPTGAGEHAFSDPGAGAGGGRAEDPHPEDSDSDASDGDGSGAGTDGHPGGSRHGRRGRRGKGKRGRGRHWDGEGHGGSNGSSGATPPDDSRSGVGGHGSSGDSSGAPASGGQLVSYVEPTGDGERSSSHDQSTRDAIGEAGVDLVCAELATRYGATKIVEKMPDRNRGYDIEVRDLGGTVHELVEVKTKRGAWDLRGVWVSRAQFETALDPAPAAQFSLAVVEHVFEPEATIHFVVDPAGQIDKYCFDYGWADAAAWSVGVPGALTDAGPVDLDGLSGQLGALLHGVLGAGLPEPEMPWTLDGVELLAAWPDIRVGIANGQPLDGARPVGWLIRRAEDWAIDQLIDTVRDGH